MQKRILFTTSLLFLLVLSQAQDQVFSQFYAAPLQLNPALTGVVEAPRITLNYRNQWTAWPSAYASYAASYDQYIHQLQSGFGLSVFSDNAGNGIFLTNRIAASYSYNLSLQENLFLRGGLEVAFEQKVLDWDRLIFLDQIDPISGYTNESGIPNPTNEERPDLLNRNYVDFSGGLLLYSNKFYAGTTLRHINSPDEGFLAGSDFGQVPILFSLHGGAEINLSDQYNNGEEPAFISPNILFAKQKDFHQLNVGAYVSFWQVFGGLWYRHTFANADAAIVLAGFRKGIVKVGYSYDFSISKLAGNTGGSHEISLVLNFQSGERFKRKKRSRQYNDCLKMFK